MPVMMVTLDYYLQGRQWLIYFSGHLAVQIVSRLRSCSRTLMLLVQDVLPCSGVQIAILGAQDRLHFSCHPNEFTAPSSNIQARRVRQNLSSA